MTWGSYTFIKRGEATMQVPLAFALMNSRAKADYTVVLTALTRAMDKPPAVEWFMMDFEPGNKILFSKLA